MPNQIAFYPQSTSGGSGLIATQVLAAPAASVTFSAIPQTFNDLTLLFQVQGSNAALQNLLIQFNGDTGANYSHVFFFNTGTSPGQGVSTGQTAGFVGSVASSGAGNGNGAGIIDIPFYARTTFNKVFNSVSGVYDTSVATPTVNIESSIRWASTAAITSITLFPAAGNFATGSSFALYGK